MSHSDYFDLGSNVFDHLEFFRFSVAREKFLELQGKHKLIGDVRGMGLLQALELVEDRNTKTPATAATNKLMLAARDNRILMGKGGLYGNVVRVSPPMNISRDDVDEFIRRLDASFSSIV